MVSVPRCKPGESALVCIQKRQNKLFSPHKKRYANLFATTLDLEAVSTRNCENIIGSIEIPVGLAGPVTATISDTTYEYYLPLATTEGALVASVNRGCKAITQAGGTRVHIEKKGMSRAPVFRCESGAQAIKLGQWLVEHQSAFQSIVQQTSNHLSFRSVQHWIRGRSVFARFVFDTDQAMGMNMVTIATEKLAGWIVRQNPGSSLIALSSNVCTDKKDSMVNVLFGRGYWVQAEVFMPASTVTHLLKTTPEAFLAVHVSKNLIGSSVAGSLSQNAQVANILAAIYLATGQDPAHAVDGSRAFLTVEKEQRGLYIALTMPSVVVGVVGGGTNLEAQAQARMLCTNDGSTLTTEELAGVVGVAALAGEISLVAALASHDLARAHAQLGRKK